MHTIRIGIREAKINLSRLLKHVQDGHSVVITEHGKPVGKLIPVDANTLPLKDRIEALETRGWIETAPRGETRKLPAPLPTPDSLRVQDLLQEDRNR